MSSFPRQCPPSAHAANSSLPAPVAGQGVGTRNRAAWLSIAEFLAHADPRRVVGQAAAARPADGKRSADAGRAAAGRQALPLGNHGENNQ